MVADCLMVVAKQLKSSEVSLRQAALTTIGIGAGATSSKGDIFKALKSAFADKTPEQRGLVAVCLVELVHGVDDFSAVPLEGLLTLCLKGLEDSSIKVTSRQGGWCDEHTFVSSEPWNQVEQS